MEAELPRFERVEVGPEVLPPRQARTGRALDAGHLRLAHRLVGGERGLGVVGVRSERLGERDRVLEGHLRAAAHGEVRGVHGVAEQRDVAVVPAAGADGPEVAPAGVVADEARTADERGEQFLQAPLAVLVARPRGSGRVEAVESRGTPGVLVGLHDEGRESTADRVRVGGEHAAHLARETVIVRVEEGEAVEDGIRGEPDELGRGDVVGDAERVVSDGGPVWEFAPSAATITS